MFDVIIPIYNCLITEIECLDVVCNSSTVNKVIVCDNSDDVSCLKANSDSSLSKIKYVPMKGNCGIAAAYNAAVKYVEADWCIILDDDTPIDNSFFVYMNETISVKNCDVLLPVVYANNTRISPSVEMFHIYWCSKRIPTCNKSSHIKSISGINAGMTIRSKVFDACRYDEALFLDMVDHRFLEDVKNAGFSIDVADKCVISQNFSRNEWNLRSEWKRYWLYRQDVRQFYRRYGHIYSLYASIKLICRYFQLVYKYKIFYVR